jgi:hypothetical protein
MAVSSAAMRCMLGASRISCVGASMKPRHPNLEWIKKVLADLERSRGDPQIAALMDRQMGDLVETSSRPRRGAEPAPDPLGKSSSRHGR